VDGRAHRSPADRRHGRRLRHPGGAARLGPLLYHYVTALPHSPFCEFLITSPAADRLEPVFGALFENEPPPVDGYIRPSDEPGSGLRLARDKVRLEWPYRGA
jgi:L-alanine-DL-glutamate epimerase-like enolase superfamily enzyme